MFPTVVHSPKQAEKGHKCRKCSTTNSQL